MAFLVVTDALQQVGKSLHLIRAKIARWRKILNVPYQEYLLTK
jgi:hypothetical protein